MDFSKTEGNAVLSKSLALIARTTLNLKQLDRSRFPSENTEAGRELLIDCLKHLADPSNYKQMSPVVLYERLFAIEKTATILERSSTDRISWPLVGYCDEIWSTLFGASGPKIFYSLTPDHNYSILPFSKLLESILNGILPQSAIQDLTGARDIYCLQLASSEDANLALYANIGHEFGHAVHDLRRSDILKSLDANLSDFLADIDKDLHTIDPAQSTRRFQRMSFAILGLARELFCDFIGAMLMGPAFFLSLFEMTWGQAKNAWNVTLSPNLQGIRAYPSFNFRLSNIQKWTKIEQFCEDAQKPFGHLTSVNPKGLANSLKSVPTDHTIDGISVWPTNDDDAQSISSVLQPRLDMLKQGLTEHMEDCAASMGTWFPDLSSTHVSADDIAALLLRFEHDLPPNIIPDDSDLLLGKPASFSAILNSSALFRLQLLSSGDSADVGQRLKKTAIVERLTAKAFETTYVQKDYNLWKINNAGTEQD